MSKRRDRNRKLRPSERARQDQVLAALRNLGARDPSAAVVTVAYADPGEQCSWCDCPDTPDSRHYTDPNYVCDGCESPARYVLHLLHGTPSEKRFALCERHNGNAQSLTAAWVQHATGGVPVDVRFMSVLDEDAS